MNTYKFRDIGTKKIKVISAKSPKEAIEKYNSNFRIRYPKYKPNWEFLEI